MIIEKSGLIIGIEIKHTATPTHKDFAGLKLLKKHLGDKFLRGILIYTGKETIPMVISQQGIKCELINNKAGDRNESEVHSNYSGK